MDRSLRNRKSAPPPLDAATLRSLALSYVARYATTSHKLGRYLSRKLDERGWNGETPPAIDGIVQDCVAARWIDDAAYAAARVGALARAGYGARRRDLALRGAGLDAEQRSTAESAVGETGDIAWASAVAYARRRRIGPFAAAPTDQKGLRRAIAALIRAGHDYDVARKLMGMSAKEAADARF